MEIEKTITSPFFFSGAIVCSVLAIFLPVHPALQQPLRLMGVPVALLSFLLALGIIYVGVKRSLLRVNILFPISLYITFSLIIMGRSIVSPALGSDNFWNSFRGLILLSPLAILSVLASRHGTRAASMTIFVMGLFAVLLYIYLILFENVLFSHGFRSLSGQVEEENYQATSFYFGLAALGLLVSFDYLVGLKKMLVFIGFLVVISLMATVGARASFLGIVLCFAISYASKIFLAFRSWFLLSIGIIIVSGLCLLFFSDAESIPDIFSVIARFQYLSNVEDSSMRMMLFGSAIELWLESPLTVIFGAGLGAFPAYIGQSELGWYPHNFVLEALAEGGIIGAFPIIILIYMVLNRFISDIKDRNIRWDRCYLGYCTIFTIIVYSFTGGFSSLWILVYFIFSYLLCRDKSLIDIKQN